MKRMIQRKTSDKTMPRFDTEKLIEFANFVGKYDEAFFELSRLLKIACTIPVTSVQSKRSFSCLKLVKNHLRTTMADCRLSNLLLLSMHTNRAKNLDLDQVIDSFVSRYPHCRIQLTV